MAKKSVSKKVVSKKRFVKKTSPSKKKSATVKKAPVKDYSSKKRKVISNLIGFLVLFALSLIFYTATNNYMIKVTFITLSAIFIVTIIALVLALLGIYIANSKRK